MIEPKELKRITKDVLEAFESFVVQENRFQNGMPDEVFQERITNRLKELVLVAENIERHSFNKDYEKVR